MKRLIICILPIMLMCACSKDGSFSWTKTIRGIATSTVTDDPTSSYEQPMIFSMNITSQWESIMDITISQYELTASSSELTLYLKDVPYELYGSEDPTDPLYGAWVFDESEIIPYVGGVPDTRYTLTNFKGTYTDSEIKVEWDIEPDGTKYHTVFQYPYED